MALVRRLILFVSFLVIIFVSTPNLIYAKNMEQPNVLILYSINDEAQMKEIRILDSLVGQFTDQITLVEDKVFKNGQLNMFTHVIYFGGVEKNLPDTVVNAIIDYTGNFYSIGHNAARFGDKLPLQKVNGEVLINQIEFIHHAFKQKLPDERIVYSVEIDEPASVLANGYDHTNEKTPFIITDNGNYYFAGETLYSPFAEVITESFNGFFQQLDKQIVKYLRLEDVHPKANVKQLREQADFLKGKNIPYMIAVIPVYYSETETVHLSDSPELVKTLQYMQKNGASIVMHGYKHQYRKTETGEGFEFWDVDNDRPIYQSRHSAVKLKQDFDSTEEYEAYLHEAREYERAYIEDAIMNGVQELVAHKLYPLAFEAPHYTMSQQGYEVLSKYFSAYVGQVQLTDLTWKGSFSPPYKTRPNFLHGMTLYPETLGYIERGNEESLQQMVDKIDSYSMSTKTYFSAFYHPFLGIEGLKEIVESLEKVANASWLDLKEENNVVQMNDIHIESGNGHIKVDKPFIASDYERNLIVKEVGIWAIPVTLCVMILVTIFIVKRRNSKKQGSF
ncbi:Uncharacterized protein YdaL [Virgibacillus pantothenticus]|nr:Uncharacterized protein YdaL [Virgibacillus pantothenticus]